MARLKTPHLQIQRIEHMIDTNKKDQNSMLELKLLRIFRKSLSNISESS